MIAFDESNVSPLLSIAFLTSVTVVHTHRGGRRCFFDKCFKKSFWEIIFEKYFWEIILDEYFYSVFVAAPLNQLVFSIVTL